eukprot:gnl/MRDRNA2_/MRDRNA2_33739_c0_seq1.p1 gnl/MRDRNA2_/MRDRNA2_33739_c0~~gnl/MRDRNA2_/MRDRNA2_33739_c0_seq1.p1  ORF type:complete len:147 (+),score=23.14 gnl/MRDRNA2_/MRDRNA2_33739_c0_seq1:56-496(+)
MSSPGIRSLPVSGADLADEFHPRLAHVGRAQARNDAVPPGMQHSLLRDKGRRRVALDPEFDTAEQVLLEFRIILTPDEYAEYQQRLLRIANGGTPHKDLPQFMRQRMDHTSKADPDERRLPPAGLEVERGGSGYPRLSEQGLFLPT